LEFLQYLESQPQDAEALAELRAGDEDVTLVKLANESGFALDELHDLRGYLRLCGWKVE
jgi:hypothetical protein